MATSASTASSRHAARSGAHASRITSAVCGTARWPRSGGIGHQAGTRAARVRPTRTEATAPSDVRPCPRRHGDATMGSMTTQNRTVEAPAPAATVVDREAAEALPELPLEGFEGVTYKLLWRSGKSVAGIMHVPPGREVSPHVHQRSHHHIWVQEGSAE